MSALVIKVEEYPRFIKDCPYDTHKDYFTEDEWNNPSTVFEELGDNFILSFPGFMKIEDVVKTRGLNVEASAAVGFDIWGTALFYKRDSSKDYEKPDGTFYESPEETFEVNELWAACKKYRDTS
jgi:hypothetical protein